MSVYSEKSLQKLREKIDLVEVVSSYIKLKSSGSTYKGLCPFHEEKTPSFIIQKGGKHYHCFGCGAHGDAIAFLMNYMKMSFVEAIETLAARFQIFIEQVELDRSQKGPGKKELRECLDLAASFYHFYLLHTDEGHRALKYLYERGIDLDFIYLFKIGFAPKNEQLIVQFMEKEKISTEILEQSGVIKTTALREKRGFFSDRILFPIQDALGHIIGFSGRKIREETFGPKYVNTPETLLFKKFKTLYGLSFSRRRIAKERRAMIVEGQIDALRLIQEGFDLTVAAQGTAFGEEHVSILKELGVSEVYLALDGDQAGRLAISKIGHLFQKEGIEAFAVKLPPKSDPDLILREEGPSAFKTYLEKRQDYLTFLFDHLSEGIDPHSPSHKSRLIQTIAMQIRSWDHPLMVHESLRKLAKLAQVPENLIGVGEEIVRPNIFIKRRGTLSEVTVDPSRVLEIDLLRWLFLRAQRDERLLQIIKVNIRPEHFQVLLCRRLFSLYLERLEKEEKVDFFELANNLESVEEQLLFAEVVQKKVNGEKAEEGVIETVTKLLQRHWMDEREKIRIQIQSGRCSEAEIFELARRFDEIKTQPPEVILPSKNLTH